MRTKIFLLIVCMATLQTAFTQGCPPNIDFEDGNFTNWECFIGNTTTSGSQNIINLFPSAPVPGRHEIMTASSTPSLDFWGGFPKLCPYGGGYSVKLGNDGVNAEAEGLSYTFTVPSNVDTFTLTYFYAVVLEEPGHAVIQQPRFFVSAYDVATGAEVSCASYNYIANGSIPGFQVSQVRRDVLYKDWTPASLQFAGLAGRTVRLEFKTADCTLGGHFGYAYVDVVSSCTNFSANAPYCIETNSVTLNAPFGFQTYTWYDENFTTVLGTGQSLTLSPPPVTGNGIYNVDMVPFPGYGCRDTLQAITTPLPVPDTPGGGSNFIYCQFQPATPLTATPSPGHTLLWYSTPTGGNGSNSAIVPSTAVPGVYKYYVSQKALFGCESLRKEITVNVYPTPITSFVVNNNRQCQNGNSFTFTSTSSNRVNPLYIWDFGDGQKDTSATDTFAVHSYANAGTYTVKLKVANGSLCSNEVSTTVTVIPKPTAAFSFPAVICENQTQVTLTDNSTVPGGVASITGWWWNINGQIVQLSNPAPFTANAPGQLTVQLFVTTSEGCKSDTVTNNLTIRNRPDADFRWGNLLCENETVQFTDRSRMPQGSPGENIVKWDWQFDNGPVSSSQNPSTNFAPGIHQAQLIAESNFGCRSIPAVNTFEIFAKPQVDININDSCVLVPIIYTGLDLGNSVTKWLWYFGNGLTQGNSTVTRTYDKEGSRPFRLVTETVRGCKDTIDRPFIIYDNKTFAGRDTVAAMSEPVQLNGRGGSATQYTWSPATGLNNPDIENPVAILDKDQVYTLFTVTDKGCKKTTQVEIKRFKGPDLYIPTAFTPNNDGLNDVLKVMPIGTRQFHYFAVYNRYGQEVFRTKDFSKGWDGKINDQPATTGVYIFISSAIDYTGKPMLRKGTVMLIR